MQMEKLGVSLEQLAKQSFESAIINLWIWVKKFEVNIN